MSACILEGGKDLKEGKSSDKTDKRSFFKTEKTVERMTYDGWTVLVSATLARSSGRRDLGLLGVEFISPNTSNASPSGFLGVAP